MEATKRTRPHWYRSYILGEWGAFEGQAFEEFSDGVHVVEPFEIPAAWERFESMDHGANNPTAGCCGRSTMTGTWLLRTSTTRRGWCRSTRRRSCAGARRGGASRTRCWADPSTGAKYGLANRLGDPASVRTEYAEHGIGLTGANSDREAGYLRLLELLHVEPGRIPPPWAHVPADVGGAPRCRVLDRCKHLIAQLKSAPVVLDGAHAKEAVDGKWEGDHGHAVAALRYGAMSRPSPSEEPRQRDDANPRRQRMLDMIDADREREEWEDNPDGFWAGDSGWAAWPRWGS